MITFTLKEILAKRGMTQKQLSDETGIRPPTISAIAVGSAKHIPVDVLDKICKALRCQPADIVKYQGDAKEKKTMKLYVNHGCLANEKVNVYTHSNPAETATCWETIEVALPEGWEAYKNMADETILVAPWGWQYLPDQILTGNENPALSALDDEGKKRYYKMETLK